MCSRRRVVLVLMTLSLLADSLSALVLQQKSPAPTKVASVEVFQVPDLPVSIREVKLVRSEKGLFLKGTLSNSIGSEILGVRYSLVEADLPTTRLISNSIEGASLPPYSSQAVTFKTPLKMRLRDGARYVLMLEQAVSKEDIWEVVSAKTALEAYLAADYSVVPKVIRAANQTDAPIQFRPIIPR